MADTLDLTSNLKTLRTTFNGLVAEFNNVATINSITADTGSINIGSGQVNKNITINGGLNLNTSIVNGALQVAMDATPTFTDFTASGTLTLTGTSNITTANVQNLNAGISPNNYAFPTAVGTVGQALVVNGSGDLEFGLGGTGVSTFKSLTDTPGTYTTLGARVLFLDGTEGGAASNVTTDDTFIFDMTNNYLEIEKIKIGNNISPTNTDPIQFNSLYNSGTAPDVIFSFTGYYDSSVAVETSTLLSFTKNITVVDVVTSLTSVIADSTIVTSFEDISSQFIGKRNRCIATGTAVINDMYGMDVLANAASGTTVTELYGIHLKVGTGGTVTNSYGLFVEALSGFGTLDYGIYSESCITTEDYMEIVTNATTPAGVTTGVKIYFKDDKLIFVYDDSGTVRYKYLDLTGTGVTWVHTTTAP